MHTYMMAPLIMAAGLSFIGCSGDDDYIPDAIRRPSTGGENPPVVIDDPRADVPVHVEGEPYDTYRGLVMTGYQGWFGAHGDGCPAHDTNPDNEQSGWYHYQESGQFRPGVLNNSIDFWPDMTEYEKKYDTAFTYPDGTTAQVYSAYDESSVLLHFKWMQEYGIDGAFMQRFIGEAVCAMDGDNPDYSRRPGNKPHFDKVLASAMKGSDRYQRAISVMYDLGGYRAAMKEYVVSDINEINALYGLKDRRAKYYLYENGKPLVALWGVGFSASERGYSNSDVQELVDALKDEGYSVMLGVSTNWRTGGGDTPGDIKNLHALVKSSDVIMPWYVGRYDNNSYNSFKSRINDDLAWCMDEANYRADGKPVVYVPHCFPGGSALNMQPQYGMINGVNGTEIDPESRRGDGGRYRGEFFWKQLYHIISSGCPAVYVAMFDEIDEGTAIYKLCHKSEVPGNVAEKDYWVVFNKAGNFAYKVNIAMPEPAVPSGGGWVYKGSELNITFQGIDDDLPSDFYLRMTGYAAKMLRRDVDLTESVPALQ